MSETNSTVRVLQSKNKENVKELIRSETSHLGSALRIINMESFAPEVVSKRRAISKPFMKRRSINKTFMKCLIEAFYGISQYSVERAWVAILAVNMMAKSIITA